MSECNILKSQFPNIEIPIISVGEYLYNKIKQFNDLPLIVSVNKYLIHLINYCKLKI